MASRSVYSDEEWGLLVGLPQSVMIAASAAEPDGARRTLAENTAGIDAIAAGRDSGNPLVREVATDLVAELGEPDADVPATVPGAAIPTPDRESALADVLDRARAAAALLTRRAAPGEAAAYKHWLVGIAEQVVGAARSGGFLGIGGEWVSEAEGRFVAELSTILDD